MSNEHNPEKETYSIDQDTARANDKKSTAYTLVSGVEPIEEEVPWSELSFLGKVVRTLIGIGKTVSIITLLYFFICSLDLLSLGFRVIGGPEPQKLLETDVFRNPVVGLMCGILFTVIVQSSSTTSSAVVGLVAGKLLDVRSAIPIIMGANIGTSITNTIIAVMQIHDRDKFRRAFAAATIHDMFNWLTTLVLLPLESLTDYLYHVSGFLVREIDIAERRVGTGDIHLLKAITEPFTTRIVSINKTVVELWSHPNGTVRQLARKQSSVKQHGNIFSGSHWSDGAIGTTVVVIAFAVLLICLILIVKILNSVLRGKIAVWIRRASNAKFKHCKSLTGYLMIIIGAVLTFVVQSSSVFTSTLPPLVAMKVLTIDRAYTLTLGSNIGTTTTAIIAALAQTKNFSEGLQIALCHTLFNLTGIILFYPIPCTRYPVGLSVDIGNITAKHRWFAFAYVIALFLLIPLLFMGLAFAGSAYVVTVFVVLVVGTFFVTAVNSLRIYPRFLPKVLHTWNWLPIWMHSLDPYDKLFSKCTCKACQTKSNDNPQNSDIEEQSKTENPEQLPGPSPSTVPQPNAAFTNTPNPMFQFD